MRIVSSLKLRRLLAPAAPAPAFAHAPTEAAR